MIYRKPIVLLSAVLVSACTSTSSKPPFDPEETARKMVGLEQKFDLMDLDGDGYLTRSELTQGFIEAGVPDVTDEKISKVIEFYDLNKDGRISLRETQQGSATGPEALIKKFE